MLDARTGEEQDDRWFRDDLGGHRNDFADLFVHRGPVIGVRRGEGVRPFSVYGRW